MSSGDSVKLYWDIAHGLTTENHTQKRLKSYYLTNCRKLATYNAQISKERFSSSQMCPKCSSVWNDGNFSMSLKPERIRSAKTKKLIAKLARTEDKDVLTKKQRTRAKWLKKKINSNVEIKCKLCHNKILLALIKPKKKTSKFTNQEDSKISQKKSKKKNIKLKEKELESGDDGIKAPIVKTVLDVSDTLKEKNNTLSLTKNLKKLKKPALESVGNAPIKISTKKVKKPQQDKNLKHKLKASEMKKTSKTDGQFRNSMLKLASLLKAKSSENTLCQQDKLQTLLKKVEK